MIKNLISIVAWPVKKLLLFLIIGIRPLLGPANCKCYPSCGNYAVEQLKTESLLKAVWNICKQLIRCSNPAS